MTPEAPVLTTPPVPRVVAPPLDKPPLPSVRLLPAPPLPIPPRPTRLEVAAPPPPVPETPPDAVPPDPSGLSGEIAASAGDAFVAPPQAVSPNAKAQPHIRKSPVPARSLMSRVSLAGVGQNSNDHECVRVITRVTLECAPAERPLARHPTEASAILEGAGVRTSAAARPLSVLVRVFRVLHFATWLEFGAHRSCVLGFCS